MPRSHGAWAFWLTTWAFCWSVLLLVAGFWVAAYNGETRTSGGALTHTSGTLVGTNGLRMAVLLAVPVALTLAAALGLHGRCTRGSRAGLGIAWTSVALLAALTIAGAASIGVLVLPVTLLVAAAARLTPSG